MLLIFIHRGMRDTFCFTRVRGLGPPSETVFVFSHTEYDPQGSARTRALNHPPPHKNWNKRMGRKWKEWDNSVVPRTLEKSEKPKGVYEQKKSTKDKKATAPKTSTKSPITAKSKTTRAKGSDKSPAAGPEINQIKKCGSQKGQERYWSSALD
jgi:hypothetical protein